MSRQIYTLIGTGLLLGVGGCNAAVTGTDDCAWDVSRELQPAEVRESPDQWTWRSGTTEVALTLTDGAVEGSCGPSNVYRRQAVAIIRGTGFDLETSSGTVAWVYTGDPARTDGGALAELESVSFGADLTQGDDARVPSDATWHASATLKDGTLYVGVDTRSSSASNEDVGPSDDVFSYTGPLD